jgi:hypothetical protein
MKVLRNYEDTLGQTMNNSMQTFAIVCNVFFFSVPVCAITASVVPGGTLVSMNRFSTLCG